MNTSESSANRPANSDRPAAKLTTKRRASEDYVVAIHREGGDLTKELVGDVDLWQRAAQVSLIGLFILAVLGCLYLSYAVIVPVLLAWVVATILMPAIEWLEEHGAPRTLAVLAIALALVATIAVLAGALSIPLTYWVGRATELGNLIRQKLQTIDRPFAMLKELGGAVSQAMGTEGGLKVDQSSSTSIVGGILSFLTPAVSQAILFVFGLIFYLIYQKQIRSGVVVLMPNRQARLVALRVITDIEHNMKVYFGTFTVVNLCLGTLTVLLTYIAGLPNPLLWGVLAAILNFIPYIGVAVVVSTLFLVGFFALPNIAAALIAPAAYVGMTTLEGQLITPSVLGHRLTLNPFSVFLSIAFWTWMWGPIGAFVAVPLLIALTVTVRHIFPQERPDLPE